MNSHCLFFFRSSLSHPLSFCVWYGQFCLAWMSNQSNRLICVPCTVLYCSTLNIIDNRGSMSLAIRLGHIFSRKSHETCNFNLLSYVLWLCLRWRLCCSTNEMRTPYTVWETINMNNFLLGQSIGAAQSRPIRLLCTFNILSLSLSLSTFFSSCFQYHSDLAISNYSFTSRKKATFYCF